MMIKERYQRLADKELTIEDFHEIVRLKNDCKLSQNKEYFHLCDLLIIDSYIEGNLLDDALKIAISSLNNIDTDEFKKIYSSFLERVIYICIQKKNYKSAYRYAFMKRNVIDLDNVDQVNRWYLEMAYIYAELEQKDKALLNLKAILSNYPDPVLKSIVLSNLTKLYIDQKAVYEAKETLSQCISLTLQLEDKEGLLYCDYLNAKIYILENNYENARIIFQDIFHSFDGLPIEYLGIGNEYLGLLIEMERFNIAADFIHQYESIYKETSDLQNKKIFHLNYLKVLSAKNITLKDSLLSLIYSIEKYDDEIQKTEKSLIDGISEEDKFLEINNTLMQTISKIENTIHSINSALLDDNERSNLIDFSKKLEKIVAFDEVLYVIFHRADFEMIPEFMESHEKVTTYEYKKERLYEREFSFNHLNQSVLELLLTNSNEMVIDFTDTTLDLKEIITGKSYLEKGTKSMVAVPLIHEEEMFAAVIFTAKTPHLIENETVLLLKIACKLLSSKLLSLFYQENLNLQKNILQTAMSGLQEGLFYYEPEKQKMILSPQLSVFLGVHTNQYTKEEFMKLIHPEDINHYQYVFQAMRDREPYSISFRMSTSDREYQITEQASPYINKEGLIKFYVGTITKLESIERIRTSRYKIKLLNESDYNIKVESLIEASLDLEYKFSIMKFKIANLAQFNRRSDLKDYIVENICLLLDKLGYQEVYFLDDESLVMIIGETDQRTVEKNVSLIVSEMDKGLMFEEQFIHLNAYASYIRYPRDTHNIKEINHFANLALNYESKISTFSEELNKHYVNSLLVNKYISEEILNCNLELLYGKLISKTASVQDHYEIKYNMKGLSVKENPQEYLNGQLLISFEKMLIQTLMKEMEYKTKSHVNAKYYLSMSTEALTFLLNNNGFKKKNLLLHQEIVICIRNYKDNMLSVIQQLKTLQFQVYLSHKTMKRLNIDDLISLKIDGICINEGLEREERVILLPLFKEFDYILLTNYEFSDYANIIYRTKELVKDFSNNVTDDEEETHHDSTK